MGAVGGSAQRAILHNHLGRRCPRGSGDFGAAWSRRRIFTHGADPARGGATAPRRGGLGGRLRHRGA
jgi:hypothetical protein